MNSRELFTRFIYCLLGWGTVGIVYQYTGQVTGQAHVLSPSELDNAVPFSPDAIWLYLSFFLFIPLGYFLSPLKKSLLTHVCHAALCAGFWGGLFVVPHDYAVPRLRFIGLIWAGFVCFD